ncbi:hypothetical protein NQ314_011267 [Rhamnusium bicolor]|uniref:Iron-sulfur clusters transporter ABCB7, mitochondrial n=1 Tax=Rhamnusium bicolor TaxID=1586634 RepID=A0AAV8XJK2_9CUCU|nr:hypothetical protein NQ314_011267 [Rhamnusium bicolor]
MAAVIILSKVNVKILNIHLRKTFIYRNFTHLHSKKKHANYFLPLIYPTQKASFYSSSNHKDANSDQSVVSGGILAVAINKVPSNIPRSQPIRGCFHPGASVLSREAIPLKDQAPITGIQMIQAMLQYIWPKEDKMIRDRVKLAVSLLMGAKVLNVTVPFIFKYAVDYLNAGGALNLETAPQTAATIATSLLLGYGIARAGAAGFNELRNAVFAKVAQHSIRKIAKKCALSKTIDRGSRGINFVLSAMVFNIVPTVFELALVSSILGIKCGVAFAGISMGCVGIYSVYTLAVTQWRTKFRIYMNQAENEAGNKAVDSLINYETVKYFNNEKFEADRYDSVLKKYEDASLKTSSSLALLNFGQNAIFSAALSAIMILAANEIVKGNMTVGDLVMVNGLLFQLSIPLGFLGSVYREVRQALIDMQTMFTLMTMDSTIKNKPQAPYLYVDSKTSFIKFENVSFEYGSGKEILKDLNLTIEPGKKNCYCWRIWIRDIRDVDLESLRRSISIVPQDSVLFHDTIKHNLHYGDLRACEEDIIKAAKMAEIHDSIWGEKQRVAIARAILKNSPILIFDEATSSLDSITEHNILKALRNATQGRTSICIAHRLSTIMDADEIFVLENGRVSERGSHRTLLQNPSSLYWKLWDTQNHSQKSPHQSL